jgi:hypothetical protein
MNEQMDAARKLLEDLPDIQQLIDDSIEAAMLHLWKNVEREILQQYAKMGVTFEPDERPWGVCWYYPERCGRSEWYWHPRAPDTVIRIAIGAPNATLDQWRTGGIGAAQWGVNVSMCSTASGWVPEGIRHDIGRRMAGL